MYYTLVICIQFIIHDISSSLGNHKSCASVRRQSESLCEESCAGGASQGSRIHYSSLELLHFSLEGNIWTSQQLTELAAAENEPSPLHIATSWCSRASAGCISAAFSTTAGYSAPRSHLSPRSAVSTKIIQETVYRKRLEYRHTA